MDKFLTDQMRINCAEMDRLMRECSQANKAGNKELLRLKHAGLGHAITVGERLIQIKNIWDAAKKTCNSL